MLVLTPSAADEVAAAWATAAAGFMMTAAVHYIISRQLVIVTPDELRGRADLHLRLGAMAQQWNRQQREAAPGSTGRDVDQLLPEPLTVLRAKLERETLTSQTLARRLAWTKTSNRSRKHANSVLQKALQAAERKNAVQEAELKEAQQELLHWVTAADTFEELHASIGHLKAELAARQTCIDTLREESVLRMANDSGCRDADRQVRHSGQRRL